MVFHSKTNNNLACVKIFSTKNNAALKKKPTFVPNNIKKAFSKHDMARKSTSVSDVLPMLSAFMSLLSEEQQAQCIQQLTLRTFKKNEVIYSEGEQPAFLYCLIAGKIKIFKSGVSSRSQIVRVIRPIGYFGYRAAFAGQKYVTAAAAFEPSVVAMLPMEMIVHMVTQNTRLAWFFLQRLSVGLGMADERMVSLTQKHIQGRLAEALLFLKDSYGLEEDGCTLSIYLSREDMANLSNMTTANAIRTLSAFAQEKIIAIDGRKIKLIDQSQLERISRLG